MSIAAIDNMKYSNELISSLCQFYWSFRQVQCCYWTSGHSKSNIEYLPQRYTDSR